MAVTSEFARSLETGTLQNLRLEIRDDIKCVNRVLKLLPVEPGDITCRAKLNQMYCRFNADLIIIASELSSRLQLEL